MKKILLFMAFLISTIVYSQDSQRINKIMSIVNSQDSISRELFLDSTTINHMYLSQSSNWRQIWNDIDDTVKSIHQFYDIRIKFDSYKDAINFHREYYSENGPEIKKHKIKVEGVDEIRVFTQNKMMSKAFLEP